MVSSALKNKIVENLPFEPTSQQEELLCRLSDFVLAQNQPRAFILKGYAGTGKTSLVSALIQTLDSLGAQTILLAPTGRAAKVLANYSGRQATSIHKEIYRQHSISVAQFDLNYNKYHDAFFIVDEASMIPHRPQGDSIFGSGALLDDLLEYIYSGDNCTLILLGDTAQLLPIGQSSTPALEVSELQARGVDAEQFTLTKVIRQADESGILFNATRLRNAIDADPFEPIKFNVAFDDIVPLSGSDLIEQLSASYANIGSENTIILTYSNKRAVQYNQGVRARVCMYEDEITSGDYIMVTKNNYFWSQPYENLGFIANGDIAEVLRVGRSYEFENLRFVDLTLRLIDYDMEITARVALDSLYIQTAEEQRAYNERLESFCAEGYTDIHDKRKFWQAMMNDEFYNALQIKFAYAITTHKAQGGAWQHVYVDQGFITEERLNRDYYQWLYTAFTRAKEKLFLVNFASYFYE